MKTFKNIFATITALLITAPHQVLAQFEPPSSVETGLPVTPLFEIINSVMLWVLALIGVIAVISFVIAGILFLTSAGNEDQIATAKRAFVNAIVGVIVALLGLIILNAATNLLSGGNRF